MANEIRKLAMEMLGMVDLVVRQNVTNQIALTLYRKWLYPFLQKRITDTDEKLIKANLQMTYEKLKPYFDKKQMKDMIDEGEKLGSVKIQKLGDFKELSKYF